MTWIEALPTVGVTAGIVWLMFQSRYGSYHNSYRSIFDNRVPYRGIYCRTKKLMHRRLAERDARLGLFPDTVFVRCAVEVGDTLTGILKHLIMGKVKPKPVVGSKKKSSAGLNRSVSTYGKNTMRFLEVNEDWLAIQSSPKHKKGLFSDSDDSVSLQTVPSKTKPIRKFTKPQMTKKKKSGNKENAHDLSNSITSVGVKHSKPKEPWQKNGVKTINNTSLVIDSSIPFMALDSSKTKHITKNRRKRRTRKSEFKVRDGCLTFSFCEQFPDESTLSSLQTTVIHGHNDSVSDFLFPPVRDEDAVKQAQSTPMRVNGGFTPYSVARTKFDAKLFLQNFGTPMSAVRTRNQLQLFKTRTFEKTDQDIFHLSFEEALSPKKFAPEKTLTAREKVLLECDQTEPKPFESLLSTLKPGCKKIGEGVFGEVYQFTTIDEKKTALKVVPIEGVTILNGEKQKIYSEILPEIVNSLELSELRRIGESCTSSFITLFRVHLTIGSYPSLLLEAWDDYDKQKTSENDRPDLMQEDQLYVVFEFADGGVDLEHYKFNNAAQALSIVKQTISGLAVAEHLLQFEHRDLHWGNILVQKSAEKSTSFTLDGETYKVETHGLTAQIIDFTLSRMSKGGISLFQDLSKDEDLFSGDSAVDYQFEIYRIMKKETGNDWSLFRPKTNVFWIHYLLDKFINEIQYKLKRTKIHRQSMQALRNLHGTVLTHTSCKQIVETSSLFKPG